ncbi:imidazole glycerol phosphate synthase subunit HisH [Legionella feeleii]|uniref:Imidazole glycerol phosphate synthase subunit HisH n=1 Tax=Legionella feeleii TaxID=453 RepID=A0A0W0U127_9GAMM|nr:imidazole glycerol phosphate synthase subunit HisH [Legionella feeleii]KTD01471.1 putative imidazole glycerol phosphate synthase,glutamine amidotransferase subunit (HisH) [Legionella feeleii]SPX61281.1 putative imidazole glycerol phosphate synthase,glutamine amidotransferase subunit (HisH) [Legionella feeleii]
MDKIIGILDYGMGNINSVYNSLSYLGYEPEIVKTAQAIERCSHLIIPGVGSYAVAMANIAALEVDTVIMKHVQEGKPLLGICLGMQILSTEGEEGGYSKGLGLIDGKVEFLDLPDLPVPHVGWNSLTFNFDHPICNNLKKHVDFYFVHSYFFNASDTSNVLALTDYGKQFPAIVVKENVVGIQFHPEKSQDNGLLLLENFCEWGGAC